MTPLDPTQGQGVAVSRPYEVESYRPYFRIQICSHPLVQIIGICGECLLWIMKWSIITLFFMRPRSTTPVTYIILSTRNNNVSQRWLKHMHCFTKINLKNYWWRVDNIWKQSKMEGWGRGIHQIETTSEVGSHGRPKKSLMGPNGPCPVKPTGPHNVTTTATVVSSWA